jgi:hypothetical protein
MKTDVQLILTVMGIMLTNNVGLQGRKALAQSQAELEQLGHPVHQELTWSQSPSDRGARHFWSHQCPGWPYRPVLINFQPAPGCRGRPASEPPTMHTTSVLHLQSPDETDRIHRR